MHMLLTNTVIIAEGVNIHAAHKLRDHDSFLNYQNYSDRDNLAQNSWFLTQSTRIVAF